MKTLTTFELQRAWTYLQKQGHKFPHGMIPGSYLGGELHYATEDEWAEETYQPPRFYPEYAIDPNADPRPKWSSLILAAESGEMEELLENHSQSIKLEVQRRINAVFDAKDNQEEVWIRLLPDGNTPARLQERERLILRGKLLREEGYIGSTLEEMRAFDPADDSHWAE